MKSLGPIASRPILRVIYAFVIACIFVGDLTAQENAVRLSYGKNGEVASASYYGRPGALFRTRLDKYRSLESVELSYGTSATPVDVHFLSTLTQISSLHFGQASGLASESVSVRGSLGKLSALQSLETVELNIGNTSDADLAFLAKLPKLKYLTISLFNEAEADQVDSVTDACAKSLAEISSLRELVFVGGGQVFSDEFVDEITRSIPKLQRLEMWSPHLTDASLKFIGQRLQDLEYLELHSDSFTNEGFVALSQLPKLQTLAVVSSSLTDRCMLSLEKVESLRCLTVPVTHISDNAFRVVSRLPNLSLLSCRTPEVTEEQFAMLSGHKSLEYAYFNGAKLGEELVLYVLDTMPNLKHVGIGSNDRLNESVRALMRRKRQAK